MDFLPKLLKRDAVRLMEASVESINLALVGLGLPRRVPIREESAQYAAQVGLIGAAAEQAMSSCLVQAFGEQSLILESGQFKSGRRILDDFRNFASKPLPRSLFLTQGVTNADEHRRTLVEYTRKFGALITARAGGLHAGRGTTRDIAVLLAKDVILFLKVLSESSRIRTYIHGIPNVPEIIKDRQIILEDLARRVQHSTTTEKAGLLSAINLILPEIPDDEPAWMDALERVSVAPREQDLTYLLDMLEHSSIGSLFKVSKGVGGESIPVVVRSGSENAIPIEPQFLRREFTTLRDQFYGDVANANGRLNDGIFDVPPYDFVLGLFVSGIEGVQEGKLTAQQAWPFIMSSLAVAGTAGPYWFLVRQTNDLNQLRAYVERSSRYAPGVVASRKSEILDGIAALTTNTPLTGLFVRGLVSSFEIAEEKRENLMDAVSRNLGHERKLPTEITSLVQAVVEGEGHLGTLLVKLVDDEIGLTDLAAKKYWARTFCEAANEEAELPGLLAVLRTHDLKQAYTAARKAFRRIDLLSNGPAIDVELSKL